MIRSIVVFCLASVAALLAISSPASAALTGNGSPSGSHYQLNIIGVPKGKTANMKNYDRRTIFVPLSGSCKIALVVGDFAVPDGNCTDGSATFRLPNPDPDGDGSTSYSVFARALGKPGGKLKTTTCATDPIDGATICSESSLTLNRTAGKTQFTNASKDLLYIYADINYDGTLDRTALFSDSLTNYFWQTDNSGLRLAQLRFYQCSTTVPTADNYTAPVTSSC